MFNMLSGLLRRTNVIALTLAVAIGGCSSKASSDVTQDTSVVGKTKPLRVENTQSTPALPRNIAQTSLKVHFLEGYWSDGGPYCASITDDLNFRTLTLLVWYCEASPREAKPIQLEHKNEVLLASEDGLVTVSFELDDVVDKIMINVKKGAENLVKTKYHLPTDMRPRFARQTK